MSISQTHTVHTDSFASSVGRFQTASDPAGYVLSFNGRRIAVFPERLAAHQSVADQQTGQHEWDNLARAHAVEDLRRESNWVRHSLTSHLVDGPMPSNTPIGDKTGAVPVAAMPDIWD